MEVPDGGLLDGPVHSLDLTINPWMFDLGEAMLDAMGIAASGEHVGHVSGWGSMGVAGREAELDAVVGKHGADAIGHGSDEGIEESRCGDACRFPGQLGKGKLAGAVDADKEVELALGGLDLGDVDVEVAGGTGLEALADGLVTLGSRI